MTPAGCTPCVVFDVDGTLTRSFSQLMAWGTTEFCRMEKSCVRLPDFLKAFERKPLFT